jgi:hypothetical protein
MDTDSHVVVGGVQGQGWYKFSFSIPKNHF